MPDRIESYKVVSQGGLNTLENHLRLSDELPGVATRLVNFEPSIYGGYRRITGFVPYKEDYAEVTETANPATGKVLGVSIFKDDYLGATRVIACRELDDGSGNYGFYRYVPLNGWRLITGAPTPSLTDGVVDVLKVRHAQFNFGNGNAIIFVDGVNPPNVFDGQNWRTLLIANTGGESSPGGDQLIDQPSVVEVFEKHIFLSGDPRDEALVVHSAPNDPYTWTFSAGAGQLTVGTDVVNIKPFRDQLFVFGTNAIKKVTVDVGSGDFLTENVTSNVGCVARDSVIELGGDLIFLAPDGLRPVAGTSRIGDVELETISKSIQGALLRLGSEYNLDTLNSVVIRSKSQVRMFIGDDNVSMDQAEGILGGLTTSSDKLEWEFSTLIGIRASCCTSGYIGKDEIVLHGDYNGKVYQQEKGNSFDGENILSVYSTPYLDFGDAGIRKTIRSVNTFIRAEGPFEMLLTVGYDWGDANTATPSDYSAQSKGAPTVYNGRNISYGAGGNVVYGGSEKPIITTDVQGSCFSMRATFVTVGQSDPYTIQGLVIDYSTAGRR